MGQPVPRIEDVETVEVGSFYLVNTVVRKADRAIVPVHGPQHADREIIKFPFRHWHIDWRFVSNPIYAEYEQWSMGFDMPWETPINVNNTTGEVKRRRLRCRRQFGEYAPLERILWLSALQEKYRNAKMKNFICPHQGIPCNATPIKDGVVVCRGHGLAFNVETGALVPQFPEPKAASVTA